MTGLADSEHGTSTPHDPIPEQPDDVDEDDEQSDEGGDSDVHPDPARS